MPLIIFDTRKGLEVKRLTRGEWRSCKAVLRWRKDGTLKKIKLFLQRERGRGRESFWTTTKKRPRTVRVRFRK